MIEIEAPAGIPSQELNPSISDKVFELEVGLSREVIGLKFDQIQVEDISYDPQPKICFKCKRRCRKFKLKMNGGGFCSKCMEEMKHD